VRTIDADALKELFSEVIGHIAQKPEMNGNLEHMIRASAMVIQMIDDAPTVQPDTTTHDSIPAETGKNDGDETSGDCISRQAAIDLLKQMRKDGDMIPWEGKDVFARIRKLPSAQPERTCVNCGRTANNGGWYADGGTRCPIEEHYALPKDGFCHLWEKRNVTDDDYPERMEE